MRRWSRSLVLVPFFTAGTALLAAPAEAQVRALINAEKAGGTEVLRLNDDGGFVIRGAISEGSIPFEGTGPLLMWFPTLAAFRIGETTSDAWHSTHIGRGSVASGQNTRASGQYSAALGIRTTASSTASVALGSETTASGSSSTAIGYQTTASAMAATAIGQYSVASGLVSTAVGQYTTASGDYSTAMGRRASTNGHRGSFVHGDNSSNYDVRNTAANQFMVRAAGGTIFYTNADLEAGVSLAPNAGAWANLSDRARKENFRDLDGEAVLRKIAAMPIPEWNYRAQGAATRHVGPMAQDFRAAFGLGGDDLTITTSDISGINMLAVQALERRTTDLDAVRAELQAARAEIAALRRERGEAEDRLARLEAALRQLASAVEGGAAPAGAIAGGDHR